MSTIVMVLVSWSAVSIPASLVAGHLLRRVSSDYPLVRAVPAEQAAA